MMNRDGTMHKFLVIIEPGGAGRPIATLGVAPVAWG
jgi:hypothetical protein